MQNYVKKQTTKRVNGSNQKTKRIEHEMHKHY